MPSRTLQITRRNSAYQVFEALLSNRQKRHHTRAFLTEGVQPINTALSHAWTIDALLYERGAELSAWARDVIRRTDADRYEIAPDLFRALSRKQEPSEIIALVHMPENTLDRIPVREDLLVAVMDRPSNPGNLGTLIRSCDAFGVHGVILTGHGVDVYDPAAISATRGSLFAIPVVHVDSHRHVADWVQGIRRVSGACHVVCADEKAREAVGEHTFNRPTVVVFGNETQGLSRAFKELCDASVRIPIGGSATSLNVAVAASIVLYEAARRHERRVDEAASRAPGRTVL